MPLRLLPLFALIFLTPVGLLAAGVEVSVHEKGTDATEARMKALTSAEKRAFEKLITERMGKKAGEYLKATPPEAVSQMVQGYEIVEESMTPNSYKGVIKVRFSDAALAKLPRLQGKGEVVAPALHPMDSNATLVIPVWRDAGGALIWESVNPWRDAVSRAALQSHKNRWLTATGDPADLVYLDSASFAQAGFTQLAPLAERYGAGKILMVVAQEGPGAIEATLRHLSAAGEQKETLQLATTAAVTATQEEKMQMAAEELFLGEHPAALTAAQKKEIAKEIPQLQEINLILSLKLARDWAEMQHRLLMIPGVEGLQVVQADWQRLRAKLFYRGKPEVLGEDLARAGLIVQQIDEELMLTIR